MKLLIFAPWIKSKGGAERVILEILKIYPNAKVITFNYNPSTTFQEFRKYNIKVLYSQIKNPILRGIMLFLIAPFLKFKDYDVLLISTSGIAELAALRNNNVVLFVHTPFRMVHNMYEYYKKKNLFYRILLPLFSFFYKKLEKKAYSKAKKIIVISKEVKQRIISYGLSEANKIALVSPLAPKFNPSNHSGNYFLYVSRFTPYKRQDLAIRAFLGSKATMLNYRLVLAGSVEDKKYFEKIKQMAAKYPSIIIMPNVSDKELKKLYKNAYAVLFLPIQEDTGLVPLEAFAYGKPVIAVNEGGPKYIVKDGENGYLVNADEDNIALAIDLLLHKPTYKKLVHNIVKHHGYAGDFKSEIKEALDQL